MIDKHTLPSTSRCRHKNHLWCRSEVEVDLFTRTLFPPSQQTNHNPTHRTVKQGPLPPAARAAIGQHRNYSEHNIRLFGITYFFLCCMQISLDLMENMHGKSKIANKKRKTFPSSIRRNLRTEVEGGGGELLYCLFRCNFSTPSVLVYKATTSIFR
jgi:hypothetical protein